MSDQGWDAVAKLAVAVVLIALVASPFRCMGHDSYRLKCEAQQGRVQWAKGKRSCVKVIELERS